MAQAKLNSIASRTIPLSQLFADPFLREVFRPGGGRHGDGPDRHLHQSARSAAPAARRYG
jgi:hypothetical protein